MIATLLTGMSAVGKSSTIARLRALGHHAIDLDTDEWSHWVPDDSAYASPECPLDWRWREGPVRALLAGRGPLFVSGTCTTQGEFYPLLDHVVLLTVPTAVAIERLESRTTNDYGKDPADLRRELELRPTVEPLLRRSACLEIDTSAYTVAEVADLVLGHRCQRSR